jgi:hypothetical protein
MEELRNEVAQGTEAPKSKAEIKREFDEKYLEFIRTISREKAVDMGVARDIFIAHARNRHKTLEQLSNPAYYYHFTGCDRINFTELDEDIKILESNFVIPVVL